MNKLTKLCMASLAAGLFSVSVLAQTPATPATPGKPATPATSATPAAPAKAAVPATPATPATPAAEPKKHRVKHCTKAKDPAACEARREARKQAWSLCKDKPAGAERRACYKANLPAKPASTPAPKS